MDTVVSAISYVLGSKEKPLTKVLALKVQIRCVLGRERPPRSF